ncbi:MAG: IS1595 family transposase [Burkholderiales bacterium]
MSASILSAPYFHDEQAAYEFVEAKLWPRGPVCPHCGGVERNSKMGGKSTRIGTYKCYDCRKPFTVKIGTIFEASHIPMHKWLQAIFLISSSKKGISSHQLQRTLGITIKSAWFMSHRIREAMKSVGGMFSSGGGTIEADATYVGGKEKNRHRSKRNPKIIGGVGKQCVFSLVQRDGGARSFHIPSVHASNLKPILLEQVNVAQARLMTDRERPLRALASIVASHETVNHEAGEYVRGDVHTNTVEGFFSILKRGIIGTYHHVSAAHLHRYTAEFDFRYTNRETKAKVDGKWVKVGLSDAERADAILTGVKGKRLMYKTALN